MTAEWIKINPEIDDIPEAPFLISDEYGNVSVGSISYDYYDAKYWYPMPKYPMEEEIITNDEWVKNVR
jgi:hypothetical protein